MAGIYSMDLTAPSIAWNRFAQSPWRHKKTLHTTHPFKKFLSLHILSSYFLYFQEQSI